MKAGVCNKLGGDGRRTARTAGSVLGMVTI